MREGMPVMERLRVSVPKMRRIWANSAMAKQGRDVLLDRALKAEQDILKAIEAGKMSLDDVMGNLWQ